MCLVLVFKDSWWSSLSGDCSLIAAKLNEYKARTLIVRYIFIGSKQAAVRREK